MQQRVRTSRSSTASKRLDPPQQIAKWLSNRIGPHKYGMWFNHARIFVDGLTVRVVTNSPFVARWIGANFAKELEEAARAAVGEGAAIEVHTVTTAMTEDAKCEAIGDDFGPADSTNESKPCTNGKPHANEKAHSNGKLRGVQKPGSSAAARSGSKRSHSGRQLEDFVVGASNRLAYSAASRLAEDADPRLLSPLFVHGPCGVGKTHLLLGLCQRFAERWPTARVRYVPAEQFTNEYIAAVRNDKIEEFRKRVRKLDLLAIDDVHFLSNKMRTQEEFLHTLDAIAMSGARVVLASDGHPRQISKFNQALVSRFLSGMVVQIDLPDRETRKALVQKIAAARHLPLSETAAEVIANRCVGSARELEGAIAKLAALHMMAGENGSATANGREPIGLVLVEQMFGLTGGALNGHSGGSARPVRIGEIIDTVCEKVGVEKSDLTGSGRHHRIVLARALVAHLAREMTTMSFPEIAQAMGRKYHSTIHTAAQRLGRQLAARERVGLAANSGEVALVDFVDQLRHEIGRARGK